MPELPPGRADAPSHIHAIDAVRGIAALLVACVWHVYFLTGGRRTGPLDGWQPFTWLHDYGWTLVDLFFVVSGYIFSHVYLEQGRLKGSVGTFARARFARLYPLHLATLLLMAALVPWGTPPSLDYAANDAWHFALNLLMLQDVGLDANLSYNIPAWSLSIELICYAVFVALAVAGRKVLRFAPYLLVVAGALATLPEDRSFDHLARGLTGFFVGHLLWRWRGLLGRIPALILAGAIAAALWYRPATPFMNFGAYHSLVLWPAVVLLALRTPWLSSAPMRWLGERSYSIYLLHVPTYWALSVLVFGGQRVPANIAPFVMVAAWVIVLAAADLSYRHFECPARRWVKQWRAPAPAPSPSPRA